MSGFLELANGQRLAYRHQPGRSPGVLFCPGFNSDMTGTKALDLAARCAARGQAYTCFDYRGHGQSSGRFEDGSIGDWKDDAISILDRVADGPQVIVGSSMGGWIMLLLALARPTRLRALVGVAAAPDFTEALRDRGLNEVQRRSLAEHGFCEIPNCYAGGAPYRIRQRLLDEGREHLLLDKPIPIELPVRLLQGMQDPDVPWQTALRLQECLASRDVELQLVKTGDHRLSEPGDLERLWRTVEPFL